MDSTTSTINTQKYNSANASVSGNISKKTLEEKIEGVIKKIAKNIKLDGFRKGKVPKNLIQMRYKEQIDQDSKQEAIQDLLTEGAKKLGISHTQILGNPAITKFEEKDGQIDVEIKISLTPEFNVDKALSCVPEVKLPAVSKKQIEERLEEIAKSRAPLKEMPKTHTLAKDDIATIDFEGFVDGKAFEGGKGENYNLSIGSNQFIPGFEDSLIGMKAGENKTIQVSFPEEYNAAHLAGKNAEFKVSMHKISQKELPKIDDAFAKSVLGDSGTLEGLKDAIKEQLEVENKTNAYNKELKEKLLTALIKEISFDLPELIVEQEMDILFRNALNAITPEEFEEIKNDEKKAKAKRDSFKEEAQKSVQVTFIMDALAKKNNIVISDNEVLQTIYYESMMMGQDPKAMMEYYKANNLLPAIKMAMIEDRVLNFLLDSKLEDSKKLKESKDSKTSQEGEKPKSTSKTIKDS